MQDKFPIIVYGEDGTHITELLLDFLDKFGSQLIEDRVHIEPPEPLALESLQENTRYYGFTPEQTKEFIEKTDNIAQKIADVMGIDLEED